MVERRIANPLPISHLNPTHRVTHQTTPFPVESLMRMVGSLRPQDIQGSVVVRQCELDGREGGRGGTGDARKFKAGP
jgi:hypothetical protein